MYHTRHLNNVIDSHGNYFDTTTGTYLHAHRHFMMYIAAAAASARAQLPQNARTQSKQWTNCDCCPPEAYNFHLTQLSVSLNVIRRLRVIRFQLYQRFQADFVVCMRVR